MHQVQEFVVADTGVGIPPAKLESILKEFEGTNDSVVETPTKAAESSEPGIGLGLAVVARAVAQLGGQLRVESKVDEGSRFSFLIPLGIYPASRTSSHSLSSASSPSNKSLMQQRSRPSSVGSQKNIEQLVEALAFNHMKGGAVVRTPSPPASA
jgi:hypothetical protein